MLPRGQVQQLLQLRLLALQPPEHLSLAEVLLLLLLLLVDLSAKLEVQLDYALAAGVAGGAAIECGCLTLGCSGWMEAAECPTCCLLRAARLQQSLEQQLAS